MPHIESSDEYVLGRDISGSIRLDAQHLLWRLHTGYTLHPAIPRSGNMKIAEVGTGTGVWLFDLAQELPDTVCLDGYDISATQFPSQELYPPNVSLCLMDSLQDPPDSLLEQYDVVHLRMWASNLRTKDVKILICSVSKLLKPGGYIQWEEANLLAQDVRSSISKEFERKANELFTAADIDYSWVSSLKASLESCGMVSIEHLQRRFKPGLIQMCTNTYLMALKEIFAGIKRTSSIRDSAEIKACDTLLDKLICSRDDGIVYNWGPVSSLARKPSV
ncbi:hypothetical protein FGADI_12201 [Fusarium gaditjirri]|uniref:Methyltransferase type 12 domain-containing protein n=1 Tax=Fusarium gaditjirri TaxID=282569 RepID=A0A8H4ST45_9HYPO|nr:hypothetical protein FGADI_12201 [Fusarium gaditjirri]